MPLLSVRQPTRSSPQHSFPEVSESIIAALMVSRPEPPAPSYPRPESRQNPQTSVSCPKHLPEVRGASLLPVRIP